ncbi:MAG: hypothetical protein AAGA35_00400 [Patescibacteria group bacterium]
MDLGFFTTVLSESMYLILVFLFFFFYATFKGRQALIDLIFGLYLALLISIEFPYYEAIFGGGAGSESLIRLVLFAVFTILATLLFHRIMPDEFEEKKLESLGKKILLAASATILVMIFSFHVLPVTEFITPGSPLNTLFGNAEYFFWWLIAPLVLLYLV